jgi:hypothetical protein
LYITAIFLWGLFFQQSHKLLEVRVLVLATHYGLVDLKVALARAR